MVTETVGQLATFAIARWVRGVAEVYPVEHLQDPRGLSFLDGQNSSACHSPFERVMALNV